jgi:hypothetical protein
VEAGHIIPEPFPAAEHTRWRLLPDLIRRGPPAAWIDCGRVTKRATRYPRRQEGTPRSSGWEPQVATQFRLSQAAERSVEVYGAGLACTTADQGPVPLAFIAATRNW